MTNNYYVFKEFKHDPSGVRQYSDILVGEFNMWWVYSWGDNLDYDEVKTMFKRSTERALHLNMGVML